MIIQQDDNTATYQIQRYEPGKIWINSICYEQNLIVRPHELLIPWGPKSFLTLESEHFAPIIANKPDILLLGTGQTLVIPSDDLLQHLWLNGIGVEFMDSRRACFTFTVLAAEERNVAACIFIV